MAHGFLKKCAVAIEKKQDSIFSYSVEKQEVFIKKLGKPADELERGYFQYRCQMKLYGWPLFALLNVAALPLSLLCLLRFEKNKIDPAKKTDCILFNHGMPVNIVPPSLWKSYPNILAIEGTVHRLDGEDLRFLKTLFKRYPFSWMLWLKVILKISQYSAAVKQYAPVAILCCDEFSYTSSVLTKYCHEKGIKLINVMHGEKLYFMRDSFVCYDAYYVWNEHYKNLLIELGAEPTQFKIEIPEALRIPPCGDVQKSYDFTYYLGGESGAVLAKIAGCLESLKKKGNRVSVRPHPRYTNSAEAQALFTNLELENVRELTIEQSLLRTKNAVSLYSTVLNQAFHNGIGVVIDDVSNPQKFRKLDERKYCMLKEEHTLLSELVGVSYEKVD